MAFNAELKRRHWHCVVGFDAIRWYRNALYNEWYSSLTEEQKKRIEDYKAAKEEKERRDAMKALRILFGFYSAFTDRII